jgi:hypothetical protein
VITRLTLVLSLCACQRLISSWKNLCAVSLQLEVLEDLQGPVQFDSSLDQLAAVQIMRPAWVRALDTGNAAYIISSFVSMQSLCGNDGFRHIALFTSAKMCSVVRYSTRNRISSSIIEARRTPWSIFVLEGSSVDVTVSPMSLHHL